METARKGSPTSRRSFRKAPQFRNTPRWRGALGFSCPAVYNFGMPSQNLAAQRERYVRDLQETLEHIVATLSQKPEVHRIILFGSYARGRRDLFTDLDLMVIMDSPLDFITRTAQLYQELRAPVDMDLFVYTPDEFERIKHRGFIQMALREGKVLYEK